MLSYIKTAWAYNVWAGARFLAAAEALSEAEFLRDLGEGVGSVRDKLAHLCGADEVWMARISGEFSPKLPAKEEFANVQTLKSRQELVHSRYASVVQSATDESLAVNIAYRNLRGQEFTTPLHQVLMHVANHGTYHRGQAASLIRRITGTPPVTDLIEYFREH